MIGHIYLVKNEKLKIIPAVVIAISEDQYTMAQIRRAITDDFNEPADKSENRFNKRSKEKNQFSNKPKSVKKILCIGQLEGLLFPSTVMLNRIFIVSKGNIVKEISKMDNQQIEECLVQYQRVQRSNTLHTKMKQLKKKIQLAQLNNERYEHYERELETILGEIGYPTVNREKSERGFLNYREVPTNGYIKIYKGGR